MDTSGIERERKISEHVKEAYYKQFVGKVFEIMKEDV